MIPLQPRHLPDRSPPGLAMGRMRKVINANPDTSIMATPGYLRPFTSSLLVAVVTVGITGSRAADSPGAETNTIGQSLVLLEGGRFIQGTDAREDGLRRAFPLHANAQFFGNPETPAHITWITRPFWIGATEVTVGQWKSFVAATGHVTTAEKNGQGIIGWSPTPVEKPLYESHDFERKSNPLKVMIRPSVASVRRNCASFSAGMISPARISTM